MPSLDDKEKKTHLQAVVDALPDDVRSKARIPTYGSELEVGSNGRYSSAITIGIHSNGYSTIKNRMKTDVDWRIRQDLNLTNRSWGQRSRDGKFNYALVAKFIAKVIRDFRALEARRATGDSIAKQRAATLKEFFKKDSLFSALNIDVTATTTRNTECGEVDVELGSWSDGARLKYDGQTFRGDLSVVGLSAEQVAAIMTVLNLGKLNILDMIVLANDSILGPSIRKLTEEMNNA